MTFLLESQTAALPRQDLSSGEISSQQQAKISQRLASVDLLRGLVMIVMALDHTRDFFASGGFNPRDVADPALFLTRWITHFCAPVFIFLAGISASLYGAQGRTTGQVSRYLLTRGLWLVLIEFTVVRLGWMFAFDLSNFVTQVIFAIGMSMIALAALVHLPRWAVATIGLGMILGHNMLDGIKAQSFGAAAPLWNLLHQPGMLDFGPIKLFVLYPLIPWIGVMAAGYALGPVFTLPRAERLRWLVALGVATVAGFVLLRASNLYGDPASWVAHDRLLSAALSFINCEKYPPSLLYLAMTLGPALLLLAAFDGARGRVADAITTFGRVPFFYYIVHIFLIHALAVLFAAATHGDVGFLFGGFAAGGKPPGYGLGLPGVYAMWFVVIALLYPLCRWFASVKRTRREWWWTYL